MCLISDNPSYFSLPTDAPKKFRNLLSLRKWSDPSKHPSATLPAGQRSSFSTSQSRRNFRSLTRANSEDAHLLALGKPRPSDLPPSLRNSQRQRHSSTGNVSSNDLLHQDMVHCDGGDNDVFLSASRNVQYYNTATLPVNRLLTSGRRHSIGSFLHRDRVFPTGVEATARSRESSVRKKFKKNSKGKLVFHFLY